MNTKVALFQEGKQDRGIQRQVIAVFICAEKNRADLAKA